MPHQLITTPSLFLPGVAPVHADSFDPISGSSFHHRDAVYYFPDEMIEGDLPLAMGRGTAYQFGTDDIDLHQKRAWGIVGYDSLRLQATVSLPIAVFTTGDLETGTWSVDTTLNVGSMASRFWTKWLAVNGGIPDRSYVLETSDIWYPAQAQGLHAGPNPGPAFQIPGVNRAGNVATLAAGAAWELGWVLPVDATGTVAIADIDAEISVYRFPAYDPETDGDPPTGTPVDARVIFWGSIYVNSACPIRNTYGDVPAWFPVALCNIVAELRVNGHTAGDTYSQLSTWDEDNTASPSFASIEATTCWSLPGPGPASDLTTCGALEIHGTAFYPGGTTSIDFAAPGADSFSFFSSCGVTLDSPILYATP
jgi:hypothetical protein